MSKADKSKSAESRLAPAEKSANAAREKNIDLALSSITKQFGEGSIMRLGSNAKMKVDTLSTGSLAIDLMLGVGGLPRGRIIEIYGPESSGKTTFCLSVIAEAQRQGGLAAFIDVEHALDPKSLGSASMICSYLNPILAKTRSTSWRRSFVQTPLM